MCSEVPPGDSAWSRQRRAASGRFLRHAGRSPAGVTEPVPGDVFRMSFQHRHGSCRFRPLSRPIRKGKRASVGDFLDGFSGGCQYW